MRNFYLFFIEQKKPVIQRDPAKGSKTEIVSAVSGKGSVDIDIGDDLRTLIGTEIVIRYFMHTLITGCFLFVLSLHLTFD